jgi:hypothetical protein
MWRLSYPASATYGINAEESVIKTTRGILNMNAILGPKYATMTLMNSNGDSSPVLSIVSATAEQVVKITGNGLTIGNTGTEIVGHLSASAALNFDLTAVTYEDLTITVTGAALSNTVALGIPNASITNDVGYFAWVSAANTVTVRAFRLDPATGTNPASSTFRVDVWKH